MSNKHTHGGRITFFNIYVGRVKKCTSKIKKCMMGLRSPRFVFEFFCYEVLAKQKKYKRAGLYYRSELFCVPLSDIPKNVPFTQVINEKNVPFTQVINEKNVPFTQVINEKNVPFTQVINNSYTCVPPQEP